MQNQKKDVQLALTRYQRRMVAAFLCGLCLLGMGMALHKQGVSQLWVALCLVPATLLLAFSGMFLFAIGKQKRILRQDRKD